MSRPSHCSYPFSEPNVSNSNDVAVFSILRRSSWKVHLGSMRFWTEKHFELSWHHEHLAFVFVALWANTNRACNRSLEASLMGESQVLLQLHKVFVFNV